MADNSGIIDAAIINFPATLQQNALRATQIQNAQQIQQQNALKLQQQQAGINALRNAYSSNQFDPQTGLPSAPAMSSLIANDPNLGLDFADARAKQQEYAIRARAQQIVANDHYMDIFKTGVVDPLLDYYNSLQGLHLSPQEMDQKLQQKKAELTKNMVQEYAPPPDVAERMGNIPFNSGNAGTWAAQSEMLQKRAAGFSKNFELQTDSTGEKYYTNKTPGYQGVYYDTGFNPKPPNWRPTGLPYEKPELEPFTDIGDPKKPTYNYNKTGPDKGKFTDQDGNIVTPKHAVPANSRAASGDTGRPLPVPPEMDVRQDDGTWKRVSVDRSIDPNTGNTVTKYAGTNQVIDPNKLGQVVYPASAARPRSGLAAYADKIMQENPGIGDKELAQKLAEYTTTQSANRYFLGGGQGGTIVRSAGNVIGSHVPLLRDYITALKNNDVTLFNRIANPIKTILGATPVLQFDAAKNIVADEISKSIIPSGGTEKDRDQFAVSLSHANNADQLNTVLNAYESLIGGQLANAYRQAKQGNVPEDKFIGLLPPAARDVMFRELKKEDEYGARQSGSAAKPPTMPDTDKAKLPHNGSAVWYKGVGTRLGSGGVVQFFIDGKWQ